MTLKFVPEAGYDTYTGKSDQLQKQRRKSNNGSEEKLDINSDAASGTIFRISTCFKEEANRNFLFVYLFRKEACKFKKPYAHVNKIMI